MTPIVIQCPTCFKLKDIDDKWKKIKSVNFSLPFRYHKMYPECTKETKKCIHHL